MKWSMSVRYQRLLCGLVGALLGACAAALLLEIWALFANDGFIPRATAPIEMLIYGTLCLVGAVSLALVTKPVSKALSRRVAQLAMLLERAPAGQMLSTVVGLLVGLVLALLSSQLFVNFKPTSVFNALSVLLYIILGSLGATVGAKRYKEWPFEKITTSQEREKSKVVPEAACRDSKVLDTSVLIDGRILDVCRCGFLTGELIVTKDVLTELQHIADSSDSTRRNRGRRGLDILTELKKEAAVTIRIDETPFDDTAEVDIKLLKLALKLGIPMMTNDYNLNKVAALTGVQVLNVNELSNALKSVVIPGEEIRISILREGKEQGQGVGFLNDGTMVVVENARNLIGQTQDVVVTTVLQTAAGRMIFTKPKYAQKAV